MLETLAVIFESAPQVDAGPDITLNNLIAGGAGATLMGLVIWVAKLVLDRTIPSRSDARANVSLVLEGLSNMVKVLQEEKIADANRLAEKQKRIDELEADASTDYQTVRDLKREISELTDRLALKDRHIQTLSMELRKFGVQVIGIDIDKSGQDLEIIFPEKPLDAPSA